LPILHKSESVLEQEQVKWPCNNSHYHSPSADSLSVCVPLC
jgi:hypothetical protein